MADCTQKLKDIFALIDGDGGGSICIDEVRLFCSSFPQDVAEADVTAAFKSQDDDNSGEINDDEFVGFIEKLKEVIGIPVPEMVEHFTRHCYKDLFSLIAEKDEVRMSDLRTLVESMDQIKLSGEELRRTFLQYDEDGSGSIEFEEFVGIASAIGADMPISALVHGFKEARAAAKERMAALKGRFAAAPSSQGSRPPSVRPRNGSQASLASQRSAPRTPAAPLACAQCPAHTARIAELEAQLAQATQAAAAEAAEAKASVAALETKVAALEKKAKAKPHAKKASATADAELQAKCERLERQVSSLQAENAEAARRQTGSDGSDASVLHAQIWALEKALEIRSRELHGLQQVTVDCARRLEKHDPTAAQEILARARSVTASAEHEAKTALGDTVENVAKKARATVAATKGRCGPPARAESAGGHSARSSACGGAGGSGSKRELEELREANRHLRQQASLNMEMSVELKRLQSANANAAPVRHDSANVQQLQAALRKRDGELEELRAKYKRAQDAIVASAGAGFESEMKLQHARHTLQAMVDSPTGSPASSPQRSLRSAGSAGASPVAAAPPAAAYSPQSQRSTSPRRTRY
eukprot:Rhum_TRINITY_DN2272_c0_g1::Rhum_TRINITY_DN2272_c0_g1_i1::g.6408::m.6408